MLFFRDGKTTFPRRSYGYWTLAQYQRLGLVKDAPDYASIVDATVLTDVYVEAAEQAKVDVPDDDMSPFDVVIDSATFDPKKPQEEVGRP